MAAILVPVQLHNLGSWNTSYRVIVYSPTAHISQRIFYFLRGEAPFVPHIHSLLPSCYFELGVWEWDKVYENNLTPSVFCLDIFGLSLNLYCTILRIRNIIKESWCSYLLTQFQELKLHQTNKPPYRSPQRMLQKVCALCLLNIINKNESRKKNGTMVV